MQKRTFTSLYSDSRTDFDSSELRKETYIFYPPSEVSRCTLAAAGFYFTGNEDISQCFACKLQINLLKHGVDPMDVHRRQSPSCPVVLQSHKPKSTNDLDLMLELPTCVKKLAPNIAVGELFVACLVNLFDILALLPYRPNSLQSIFTILLYR